ncbi:MAG: carbohydrate-binding protein, partial [Bacteroidota bacterium]
MGSRNPFRISVDQQRGWLYWGEVGPDAQQNSSTRGPRGYDEWNQARSAGNYGWPYCLADNKSYRDFDFDEERSGSTFDCANLVNDSPNNTGAAQLPPARPAMVWYPYAQSDEFPVLGTGARTAMAGPVYYHDAELDSKTQLPAYFDDTVFIYEWSRNWIKELKLNDDGEVLVINDFLPDLLDMNRPMDIKVGPDGALYVLEWGSGFGGNNDDAQLIKIEYRQGTRSPIAIANASVMSGPVPLTVEFSSEGTFDPDTGDEITIGWDFNGDGTLDSMDPNPAHTYTAEGDYNAVLVVTDQDGNEARSSIAIVAGNTAPLLSLTAPVSGGFFDWGETIGFEMTASDAEDGALGSGIACGDFETRPLLGHDNHAHPLEEIASCDGSFVTADGHGEDGDKIFYVVEGTYTDNGNGSAGPLTASDIRILQPKRLQAQHFTAMQGIQTENTSDPRGGIQNVGFIDHGEYLMFEPINLTGIGFISFRVASNNTGGQIEVRLDGVDGELVGTVHVPHTGGWQTWTDRTISIPEVTGTHQLFLLFQRFPGNNSLFNVNYMQFHGQGIALSQPLEINGLNATYFDNRDLNGAPVLERVDPQVSFDWDEAAPAEGMPEQRWSARWSGFVEAQNDLRTRFYVQSDEGVRLWIDGELEIDEWNNRSAREFQTSATRLRGGQRYHIQVEYVDNRSADAEVILMWDHLGDKDVIRYDHLFPSMSIVNTEDGSELPNEVTLDAAYPNPFRDQTQIRYELPVPGPVTLDVFDPLGRKVRTLVEGTVEAGTHTVTLNAGDLASGTYVYRLKTEQRTLSRQLVLVK